jgi:hypothetical protein
LTRWSVSGILGLALMDEYIRTREGIDISAPEKPVRHWWRAATAFAVFIILGLLLFVGCRAYAQVNYNRMVAELEQSEALWESKLISSYSFVLEGEAWTAEGYQRSKAEIAVVDRAVASKQYEQTRSHVPGRLQH